MLPVTRYFTQRNVKQPIDYEQAYWGTITDPDGKVRNRLEERERYLEDIKQELRFLNSLPPGRIVDVGCGLGYLLSGLRSGWERYGVEVSRFAAAHAEQWGAIFVGDLTQARFPDAFFDVVVLYHVIEHVENPISLLQEVRRILRPQGNLLLGTPDFDSGCARRFGANYRLLSDPTHISLFTNDSMHRFLGDFGFVIERVDYPFFETRWFTAENLLCLFETDRVSPPFYGNYMTFYCRKPADGLVGERLRELGRLTSALTQGLDRQLDTVAELMVYAQQAIRVTVTGDEEFASLVGPLPCKGMAWAPLPDSDGAESRWVDPAPGGATGPATPGVAPPAPAAAGGRSLLVVATADEPTARHVAALRRARTTGLSTILITAGSRQLDRMPADLVLHIPTERRNVALALMTIIVQALNETVTAGVGRDAAGADPAGREGES